MTNKRLFIKKVVRFPNKEELDTIEFKEGVNVIVGELNAGKTKWLQMIDYVLGDQGKPEEAFDKELAEKYDSTQIIVMVDGETFKIERRWKESGIKSKILINDVSMSHKEFSEFLLNKLGIPIINMPSGNPYSDRTWPEIGWRDMFRHMYKQERFWSDFTQKQPDAVRIACILNFLDVATKLYPKELSELISKKKSKDKLEAQKDVFNEVLQNITVEVVGQSEMSVAVTPDSIEDTRQRLNARLSEIMINREQILLNYQKKAEATNPIFNSTKQKLELLHQTLGKAENTRNECVQRNSELFEYTKTLKAELARFERIKDSSTVLADLKVTHCPACDQEITEKPQTTHHCYLCEQSYNDATASIEAGNRRIQFEIEQVTEELNEMEKLIEELTNEIRAYDTQIANTTSEIKALQLTIKSANTLSILAIPPELAIFEQEMGNIAAQLQQLVRVERSLTLRAEMNTKILTLEKEISALDIQIRQLRPTIDYEGLSDLLSDKMNTYINMVEADGLSRWKTGRVSIKLSSDKFEVFLDEQPWTVKAGGTANYIIQIAYHYALFSLSQNTEYNYPGLLIIDFPPHFSRSDDLKDSENYLLKPFVNLCSKPEMAGTQVIITGRAFDNLKGANIIHF